MLILPPPFLRCLPSNLRPPLRRQSLAPRRTALQAAAPGELLSRSERRGLVLPNLAAGDADDELRQLVRVTRTLGVLSHAVIMARVPDGSNRKSEECFLLTFKLSH